MPAMWKHFEKGDPIKMWLSKSENVYFQSFLMVTQIPELLEHLFSQSAMSCSERRQESAVSTQHIANSITQHRGYARTLTSILVALLAYWITSLSYMILEVIWVLIVDFFYLR